MDFPLPIRSVTSTMDYTTSLYVDTNIVYQIDETKFMGLQESSHASEPALIVECNITWNSNNTCDEMTGRSTITDEEETQELYNLIESVDVETTVLFPFDATVNIFDLPEMTSESSTVKVSVPQINSIVFTSVFDMSAGNANNSLVNCVSSNCLTSDTDYINDIIERQFSICKDYHQMPSCRFKNERKSTKRKRHLSSVSQEDPVNDIQTEVRMPSKRKKIEPKESCQPVYSNEFCLDSFMDDNFVQLSFYHEAESTSIFNFCENSDQRFV